MTQTIYCREQIIENCIKRYHVEVVMDMNDDFKRGWYMALRIAEEAVSNYGKEYFDVDFFEVEGIKGLRIWTTKSAASAEVKESEGTK